MVDDWWHEKRQNKAIEQTQHRSDAIVAHAESLEERLGSLAIAMQHRIEDLEQTVAMLVEALSETNAIDRRVLDMRIEARLDEVRSTRAPSFRESCLHCGKAAGDDASCTPFGVVCAACDNRTPNRGPVDGPYR